MQSGNVLNGWNPSEPKGSNLVHYQSKGFLNEIRDNDSDDIRHIRA